MASMTCTHERCAQYFKERGGDNGQCLVFIRECRERLQRARGLRRPETGA